jgi:seryl-tRNA synthetase
MSCLSGEDPQRAYQDDLVAAGLLLRLGAQGLYARSGVFEGVIRQFEAYVHRAAPPVDATWRLPPVFARDHYCGINHIYNFPDLLGSIDEFKGADREHQALLRAFEKREEGEDWTRSLGPSNLMMVPAACYPIYPTLTGTLPPGGRLIDLQGFVFRNEPSDDPCRMLIFRQQEYVCVGTPQAALDHRDAWIERGLVLLRALGLPVESVVANDPFFGRGGRLAKATQREQTLKFELVVPVTSEERPTAVTSSNCHLDYFGGAFDIRTDDGELAHSACVGVGIERVALALFRHHGFDVSAWPAAVRRLLELG